MNKGYRNFLFTSLGVLLLLSAYPVIMGFNMMRHFISNGIIAPQQYSQGVIPYAAICLSLLIVTALHPILTKLFKKIQLVITTFISLGLFVAVELIFEGIKIDTKGILPVTGTQPFNKIDVWQAALCSVSPKAIEAERIRQQALQEAAKGFDYVSGNISYKIHYFLVSFVIIALVTSIIYGFGKMVKNRDYSNKSTLILQLISGILLISLCVFANITGFFRDASPYLNPASALLTSIFFIVLGTSFGMYVGSYLINKTKIILIGVSSIASVLVCAAMYVGEFVLLDGTFYRFGENFLFAGIPNIVIAPIDIIIILLSGIISSGVLALVKKKGFKVHATIASS